MSVVQRAASAVLALALAASLSSCAAGFEAATDKVQADNASGEAGSVLARALVVVKSKNAIPAALAGTLINRGPQNDVLERIELTENTPGARTITLTPDLTIRAGEVLPFGTEGNAPLTVPDAADLRVGNFADLVLRFRTAGEIRLQVPVVVRSGFYADIVPSAPPPAALADENPTGNGAKANRRSAKPVERATPTPTATEPADDEGSSTVGRGATRSPASR